MTKERKIRRKLRKEGKGEVPELTEADKDRIMRKGIDRLTGRPNPED